MLAKTNFSRGWSLSQRVSCIYEFAFVPRIIILYHRCGCGISKYDSGSFVDIKKHWLILWKDHFWDISALTPIGSKKYRSYYHQRKRACEEAVLIPTNIINTVQTTGFGILECILETMFYLCYLCLCRINNIVWRQPHNLVCTCQ